MPLRRKYGRKAAYKRRRSGLGGKKYGKYSKKRRFGRRKGGKRSSGVLKSVLKDGIKYTTIYKTAVRVACESGICKFVVLDQDPNALVFKKNGQLDSETFRGDMTFYGNRDKIEALRRVNLDMNKQMQGEIRNESHFIGQVYLNAGNVSYTVPLDTRWKIAYGQNQYNLWIKSAITGANVSVTLYKCVARYDIPNFAYVDGPRPDNLLFYVTSTNTFADQSQGINPSDIFNSLQNIHAAGWISKYDANPGVVSNNTADNWQSHQEGTTLYDNEMWCKLFKIVKSYKAELLPGQSAKLQMKQKMKLLNPVADVMKRSNVCNKGQVVFVLKIQGSIGHQKINPTPAQEQFQFNGSAARPNIGLMPAAVDVMCFKKFNVKCKYIAKNRIKNIITYPDYYDDGTAEALTYDYFIDAAPSDYAQGPAVINQ